MSTAPRTALTIDRATPDDYPAIAALARIIWPRCFQGIITAEQIGYMIEQRYRPEPMARAVEGGMTYEIIRAGDREIGFGAHGPADDPGEWKLWQVYVLPDDQGRGVGSRYIEHVAAAGAVAGRTRLVLTVNRHNAAAIAVYLRRGFRIRESVAFDIGNGFVMDDYVLERRIG